MTDDRRVLHDGHVWVDGALLAAADRHVSAFDRGFQMGDAVFETLRARGGRVAELGDHLARLRRSAGALDIALGAEADSDIEQGIAELLAADGLDGGGVDSAIRITVSRGVWSSRRVLPPRDDDVRPTVVIQAWPASRPSSGPSRNGISLVVSGLRRDPSSPLVGVKTTSRVEYVYARLEARRRGADDALFVTVSGHLSEATTANVFLVRTSTDGASELATPSLDCAALAGTTRSWLLRWAPSVGLRPVEDRLTVEDLAAADEAFLSSSVAGIVPVVRFEDRPIGDGRPGPWTARARADREAFIAEGEAGDEFGIAMPSERWTMPQRERGDAMGDPTRGHIRQVTTVAVPVDDQERALRFYTETLGLEKRLDVPFGSGQRWIEVGPPGGETTIALPPRGDAPVGVDTGIRLSVDDAGATHRALREAGADVGEMLRWPNVPPMFVLADPDGNRLYLVEATAR